MKSDEQDRTDGQMDFACFSLGAKVRTLVEEAQAKFLESEGSKNLLHFHGTINSHHNIISLSMHNIIILHEEHNTIYINVRSCDSSCAIIDIVYLYWHLIDGDDRPTRSSDKPDPGWLLVQVFGNC